MTAIVPPFQTKRFEVLTPGELFIPFDNQAACFAIKTKVEPGGGGTWVPIGPNFPPDCREAVLYSWRPGTVVSVGNDYSVVLSADPSMWFLSTGNRREAVCLALSGDRIFVCANCGDRPASYAACFIELNTGEVRTSVPDAAYTKAWEIVVNDGKIPHRILRYPLEQGAL